MTDEDFYVDESAKLPIALTKKEDSNGETFYMGKIQFNGSLDLDAGQSFFIFTSEEGVEEIQVGPLDPSRKKHVRPCHTQGDKLCIALKKYTDGAGKAYYVGELYIPNMTHAMHRGIFCTVFTSRLDEEELHIAPLKVKHNNRKKNYRVESQS